jgi:Fe-S cluster assembly protein SufD
MNVLQDYEDKLQLERSSISWVAAIQAAALKQLACLEMPTRRHEEWKYTPIDDVAQQMMLQPVRHHVAHTIKDTKIPVAHKVVIDNGYVCGEGELNSALPPGVIILPLSAAINQYEEHVRPYLQQVMHTNHALHALNAAMIHDGLFIYVPKGVRINKPIALVHHHHHQQAIYLRHLIVAEAMSEVSIVEEYYGDNQYSYLTNTLTEIHVGAGAKVVHYNIQRESKSAYHFGHVFVKQMAHSQFESHMVSLGAKLARSDVTIDLVEEHAQCVMNGIYAPTDAQHVDHHTVVNHLVPHGKSTQDYKGILRGKSRGVFNGKVIVAKNAQHTDATQHNKNLLLSSSAEINTKPQLEIFADDVLCAHGATVGQLDEDALFYLATRGIDRVEASRYLINAFAIDNIRLMPHQELAQWVSQQIVPGDDYE